VAECTLRQGSDRLRQELRPKNMQMISPHATNEPGSGCKVPLSGSMRVELS